jgi:serine/threonine protein kinase
MSPARVQGIPYSYEADMWSLGIFMIVFMTGKPPFPTNRGHWQLMNAILHGSIPILMLNSENASPELIDFIRQCLDAPIGDKTFANVLLNYEFLTSAREHGILTTNQSEPPLLPQLKSLSRFDETTESSIDNIVETATSWQLEGFKKTVSNASETSAQLKLPQFPSSQIRWLAYQMGIESGLLEKK